tara:strand:+ start:994 stop:1218 length:225 start_codon:yes stop_codon:yes gene_type:complete
MSSEEGNLVSFKVFLARDGSIVSELKHLPIYEVDNLFSEEDVATIAKIIREGLRKLKPLHKHLEKEVQAIQLEE